MIKYINHATLLCLLLFAVGVEGRTQSSLSLEECKRQALEHNQTVKAREADYRSGEAALTLSKRASLPNFDFDANYLYSKDPMQMEIPGYELPNLDGTPSGVYSPGSTTNLQYTNTYDATISAGIPIYLGGKLAHAREIATRSLYIAESEIALSQTTVLLNIEEQYWTLVSLIETQELSNKSIKFLTDVLEDVNNQYESGIVTKNEVLKTQVELNNAKLSDITLHNNIEMLKMALNQSIGREISSPLQIADAEIDIYIDMDRVEGNKIDVDKRKEIEILSNITEIYEYQQKLESSDYRPQIAAFGNYYYQNPNHLAQEKGELSLNAGVTLSIPIFHWGEKRLKDTKAEMSIESAKYQLDQTKELLTLEVHQSIFKLRESMTKLQFTITALDQSEENLKLETNRLKEQVSTTTDLLNAQVQWQKAESDYISAKANVKISEATYAKAIGQLNP